MDNDRPLSTVINERHSRSRRRRKMRRLNTKTKRRPSFLGPINATFSSSSQLSSSSGLLMPADHNNSYGSGKDWFGHGYSKMSLEAVSFSASPSPANAPKRAGSSIIKGHAQVALTDQFLVHNAVLLSVACVGAFLLIVVNLVGVVFCRGYFKKKPRPIPSSFQQQPLSYSRRCHYSAMRRMSCEPADESVLEELRHEHLPMDRLSTVPEYDGVRRQVTSVSLDQENTVKLADVVSIEELQRPQRQQKRKWRDRLWLSRPNLPYKLPSRTEDPQKSLPQEKQQSEPQKQQQHEDYNRRPRSSPLVSSSSPAASLTATSSVSPHSQAAPPCCRPTAHSSTINIPVASTANVDTFPALVVHW